MEDGDLGLWLVANDAAFRAVERAPVERLEWQRGGGRCNAQDAVGKLADDMRQGFCNEDGHVVSLPLAATHWPFYAALQGRRSAFDDYKRAFTMFYVSVAV